MIPIPTREKLATRGSGNELEAGKGEWANGSEALDVDVEGVMFELVVHICFHATYPMTSNNVRIRSLASMRPLQYGRNIDLL